MSRGQPHHHPWRRLRELAHVALHWHDHGPMGWARHSTQEISLRSDLNQAERRCTLTHELEHLARGAGVRGFSVDEERAVERAAAKQLIDLRRLGEALAWAHDLDEAADELWVDRSTLDARLEHLHPAERAYLRRRLTTSEDS